MERKFMTSLECKNFYIPLKFTDRKTFKWTQVPRETEYLVIFIETNVHSNFTFHVIHYGGKNNKTYKCGAPSHFVEEIQRNRSMNQQLFFEE